MKYSLTGRRLLLSFMFPAALCWPVVSPWYGAAPTLVPEADSRQGWQLLDGRGAPWLKKASSEVQLADGATLSGSDPRYRAAIETTDGRTGCT